VKKQPVKAQLTDIDRCDSEHAQKLTNDRHSSTASHWTVQWSYTVRWYCTESHCKFKTTNISFGINTTRTIEQCIALNALPQNLLQYSVICSVIAISIFTTLTAVVGGVSAVVEVSTSAVYT